MADLQAVKRDTNYFFRSGSVCTIAFQIHSDRTRLKKMARPGRFELPTLEATEPRCAVQAGKERTTCKCTPVNGLEATSWSDALLLGNLFLRHSIQLSYGRVVHFY